MKRELVKSMRTVALLAMFSQDSSVVNNIQGCLKSMCIMEPDLILEPILERAVPSLEALTEVRLVFHVIEFTLTQPHSRRIEPLLLSKPWVQWLLPSCLVRSITLAPNIWYLSSNFSSLESTSYVRHDRLGTLLMRLLRMTHRKRYLIS